jgi:hypothetical protein
LNVVEMQHALHWGCPLQTPSNKREYEPSLLKHLHPEWAVDPERAAAGLNSVILEIDDDADHGVSGRHYWVAANIYLPTDFNPATDPLSRPFGQK